MRSSRHLSGTRQTLRNGHNTRVIAILSPIATKLPSTWQVYRVRCGGLTLGCFDGTMPLQVVGVEKDPEKCPLISVGTAPYSLAVFHFQIEHCMVRTINRRDAAGPLFEEERIFQSASGWMQSDTAKRGTELVR